MDERWPSGELLCVSPLVFLRLLFLKRLSQTVFHFSRVYAINIGTHPRNDASGEYVPIETTFASIGVCPYGRAKAKRRDVCTPLRCFKIIMQIERVTGLPCLFFPIVCCPSQTIRLSKHTHGRLFLSAQHTEGLISSAPTLEAVAFLLLLRPYPSTTP